MSVLQSPLFSVGLCNNSVDFVSDISGRVSACDMGLLHAVLAMAVNV